MNIKPKKEATPQKIVAGKPYGKPVTVDWSIYELDPSAVLPYGKFVGKTVSHIQANEEWYWNWMVETDVLAAWGLLELREQKKPYSSYVDDVGSRWLGLMVYDRKTTPAPKWWYE